MWQLKATSPKLPILEKGRHHLAWPILPDDFKSPALVVVLIHFKAKGGVTCRASADPFRAFRANLASTRLRKQKTDYHLIPLHLLLPEGVDQSAHTP